MSNYLFYFKAKSTGENDTLYAHTLEALKRAKDLKDFLYNNNLNISNDPDFFKNLYKAIILHDLGKINYKFQKKMYKNQEFPKDLETLFENHKVSIDDHEIFSWVWALILLDNVGWNKKVRTAILLHHYNEFYLYSHSTEDIIVNYEEDIKNYLKFIKEKSNEFVIFFDDFLSNLKNELNDSSLDAAINEIKFDPKKVDKLIKKINEGIDVSKDFETYEIDNENLYLEFFVFLGALRRCDYSSSGNVDIEKQLNLENEYVNTYKKIINKFGNDIWQNELLESLPNDKDIILIAPTGSGKTEFALLYSKRKNKKLVYTLPLRVALNDLYNRFSNYFEKNDIGLLHSTAFIEYIKEGNIDIETKLTTAKLLSFPFLLTTPDQIFLASLKYYGFDKVTSLYSYTLFIIDEIQAYNSEMAAIIINTIKMIKELGGNVLIITATFPPYFEKYFKDMFEIVDCSKFVSPEKIKNYSNYRHKFKIIEIEESDDLLEHYEKEITEIIEKNFDKNIFVVMNTVEKAVEIHKKLKDKYEDRKIVLLHSRLLEKEKENRINQIKEELNNNEKFIVVSTQIIEASVDLDFDLMITEISPIESQIQRWGRVYRKNRELNENAEPNIFILVPKKFDRGTVAIYDKKVLEKTFEVLKKKENMRLNYKDEKELIEKVYSGELKEDYENKIEKVLEFLKYYHAMKRSEAQRIFRKMASCLLLIPQFIELDNKDKIIQLINENKRISEIANECNIDKWDLIIELYKCSIPVQHYYIKDLHLKSFGPFYIFNVNNESKKKIKDFGITKSIIRGIEKADIEDAEDIF